MIKIVIVGIPRSFYSLKAAVMEANELNWQVILVDKKDCQSLLNEYLQNRSIFIGVNEVCEQEIIEKISFYRPDMIIALSEFYLELAALIREKMNIKFGESYTVEQSIRDKYKTRLLLKNENLTKIKFALLNMEDIRNKRLPFKCPVVIKPRDLTGSIGVHYIASKKDLESLIFLYMRSSYLMEMEKKLLVEQYIPGAEISVEGLVVNKRLFIFSLTDKRTTGVPYFIETGHTIPSIYSNLEPSIKKYLQKIISALSIGTAPIHAELKIQGNQLELIEIHTRYGGDCITQLIYEAFGYKVYKLMYLALLEQHCPKIIEHPVKIVSVQFVDENRKDVLHSIIEKQNINDLNIIDLQIYKNNQKQSLNGIKLPCKRIGHVIFHTKTHKEVNYRLNDLSLQ